VAGRLLLYSLPPLMILAGAVRGCRPGERFIAVGVAAAAAAVLALSIALLEVSGDVVTAGSAYASMVILCGVLAMMIRGQGGGDGRGRGDEGGDEPPGPSFDWDDFERRFWADVRRRASSGRGRPGSGRSPSRAPSAR
jgi:hypothetical protein